MRPISKTDGHDGPRLIDEFIAGVATVVENIVVGEEHAVGEPVVADELLLSAHSFIYGHFHPRRNRLIATTYHAIRTQAFNVWHQTTCAQNAA